MAQPKSDCRSPVGLDCCNCCLDLAHRSGLQRDNGGDNNNSGSPTVSNFRQLQEKLVFENLNTDKLNSIMRQDSLEPVLRDPCYLINEGICNRNIDQTMLSILLFFHRWLKAAPKSIPDRRVDESMSWQACCSLLPHLGRLSGGLGFLKTARPPLSRTLLTPLGSWQSLEMLPGWVGG
ncbi:hypothetical protein FD754_020071 [Muntiacus muntjak]|uniref:TSC22 domain family member 3 n=1 Tax=Muntiacus muntjak TaxID=9888 RepID=A0A5N3V1Y9_MUNMU|nr:hypothetical protein FD754_020071 [Muntiacus muntjak]